MNKLIIGVIILTSMWSTPSWAEPTVPRKISSIELQGADGTVLIKAAEAWGISCAGTYVDTVYFDKISVAAYEAMLSMTLSAYMANKTVRFYGGCNSAKGNNFYSGTYMILSDS
jgi:hypothetical protein